MKPLVPETIETERLRLRQFTLDDCGPVARLIADAEVMRFIGGASTKSWDAWGYVTRTLGHWVLRGYGPYAAVEKATGVFVGRVGFLNPETWPGIEIAWTLARPYWGKGYATEAAAAVARVGFGALKADRLISLIHPENVNSRRVAERIGAVREGPTDYFGAESPADVYRHDPARHR
jgi:RimJ/RimL family protein N-acetyltransferase